MDIKQKITRINRTLMTKKQNKYIVIHYVGAVSSAKNNANYFYLVNRGASAHYFVDDKEIWQVVNDCNSSWHCGAKVYFHSECRNTNSIGIEMCCKKDKNGKLYISEKTIQKTIELVKLLMKKYKIDINHVLRHYDVTHKNCPAPFVENEELWINFKNRLIEKEEETFEPYLVKIDTNVLNVRAGAGTKYKITTRVNKGEVYTVIGEVMNGNTKWLRLKSGVGFISSMYTKRI